MRRGEKHILCEKCGKAGVYSKKHDAMFCKNCNIWLQKSCGSNYCDLCNTRPERPIDEIEIMIDGLLEKL